MGCMKMERPNLKSNRVKAKDTFKPKPVLTIQEPTQIHQDEYIDEEFAEQEGNYYDNSQMQLGVEDRGYVIKQRVSGYRTFFKRRKELLEFSPNWRAPWLPLTVVFTTINFLILSVGLVYLYQTKKTIEIPFIYDSVDRTWFRNDVATIFIVGAVYLAISYAIIMLSGKISNFDRRLSAMINAILFFVNILFNVGIIQIFLLIS